MGAHHRWEAFQFAKTNYYVTSIGVHCVKHDGWNTPLQCKIKKRIINPFEIQEFDLTFCLLYHQRDD